MSFKNLYFIFITPKSFNKRVVVLDLSYSKKTDSFTGGCDFTLALFGFGFCVGIDSIYTGPVCEFLAEHTR